MLSDELDDWDAVPEESMWQLPTADSPQELDSAWVSDGWYDEWHTPTADGWIVYSEMQPWMDIGEVMPSMEGAA